MVQISFGIDLGVKSCLLIEDQDFLVPIKRRLRRYAILGFKGIYQILRENCTPM